ncbi:hypothetical protein HIM_08464 [Hirsutella minnesotensis 3608]|uniref:Carrier domain-containing protein n=1 Tax=Hirsutella minnesotensis 3608 TaxID=1043627 RepID=A0A0F8A3P7_9HYPO|nr:hypothetical protein HIM_08464 [Hirsutella minnesotensis 3608]
MEALGLAGGKVDIASRNTPTQTVISGDADAAESLAAHFAAEGHKTKTLNVSHAFHSHHVDGMLAAFQAVAETVRFSPPTTHVAVVSGLTGKLAETGQLQRPEYWVRQARGAVRFSDGIQTLADHLGVSVFLELGPRPVLCGLGAACLGHSNKPSAWVPSLIPGKDGASVMQGSLAELHVRLVPVSWPGYFEPFGCRRVELPTYAFQREPLRPDVGPPSPDTGAQLNGTSPVLPGGGLRQALSDGSPEQGAAIALELVREIATETLGFASPADVDVDQPLQDLGIDSMTAALLHNRLAGLAGFTLPAGTVSDHPNLRALSHFLLSRLETDTSTDSASSSTVGTSPSDVSAGLDEALPAGCSSVAIATSQSADVRRLPDMSDKPSIAIPPLNHVILAWCSPLLHDFSPTSGILPGYGQAIAFISQCFIPANQQRDQFFGCTLAHSHGNTATNGVENMATCSDACSRTPPLRHMLSLFRPSDPSHLKDPSRPILRVATLFALGGGTSGYEGILHGGLTATLLDESLSVVNELNTALGKTACLFAGISVTASLNVRFLAPVATTEAAVCVTTWVEGMQGLKTILKGEMTNSKGSKLADAESVFVAVGPKT